MRSRLVFGPLAVALVPLFYAPTARADAEDTLNLTARYAVQTDSNLFRLSSAAIASGTPANQLKTERIHTGSVAMTVDKTYSLQRFLLNGSLVDYRYQTYGYLSYNAFNYAAAWNWSATPWLRGTLSSTQQQSLNNFADYRDSRERNIRTTKTTRFEAENNLGAALRLLGGLEQSSRRNDLPVAQEGDDEVQRYMLGLRYEYPSGSSLTYRMRNGRGDYLNRTQTVQSALPSHFEENIHELMAVWPISGKSTLRARFAHLERTHPQLQVRNFSGPVGDITFDWEPTAKLSLAATLSRTLSPYQTDTSSYVATDRFTLTPVWRISAHTSLRATYTRSNGDYGGPLPGQAPTIDRHDTQEFSLLGLEWKPRPTMALGVSVQSLKNISNTRGFDYKANGANVSAQITF
jgi:exopolysaccharide biosynthesis operon protein EpsL